MSWTRFLKYPTGIALAATFVHTKMDTVDAKRVEEKRVNPKSTSEMKLKHVQVYFRHGVRTPIHVIPVLDEVSYDANLTRDLQYTYFDYEISTPTKPHDKNRPSSKIQGYYESKPKLKGGAVLGSMTTIGQKQMYALGLLLRRDYGLFLDKEYDPEEIYVQSTNIDRTIASLRCVLAGLYGIKELNSKGPINILVSEDMEEMLFPNSHNCHVLRQIVHAAMIHFDDIPGIKEDREFIEKVLGVEQSKGFRKLNFIHLRDDIIARRAHGYEIPANIQPHMNIIEKNAIKIMFHAFSAQHESEKTTALRLTAGLPMSMTIKKMAGVVEGKSKEKICLYSAHDSTLVALLCSLDIFDHKWPPFAADLRFELHEDKYANHWVKVIYLGKEQKIRGCKKTIISFKKFKKLMQPMVIEKSEYQAICKSDILEKIGKELLKHEKGEVETAKDKEDSDKPAGM